MTWNVVFADKSLKLLWICMKLGRWGWGLKRLSLERFQRNRAMGFGESAKKWVAEALFFLWRVWCITSATFLESISAKLSKNTCPGGVSRHMVSCSRKVSIKGSNFFTLFLGYPICDQPTGHGKRSATPTLFPSPGGHTIDVPYLGDFCWGMYRFLAIHVQTSSFAMVSTMAKFKPGCLYFFKHTRQGAQRSDRRFSLVHYSSAHLLAVFCLIQFLSLRRR